MTASCPIFLIALYYLGNVDFLKGISRPIKTNLAHQIAKHEGWRELGCAFEKSHKFTITESDLKKRYCEYTMMGGASYLCERLIEELESKNITVEELIEALEDEKIDMHDIADDLRDKLCPEPAPKAEESKTVEDPDWVPDQPSPETPRRNSKGATKRKQDEISPPTAKGPREKRRRDNSCHSITFSYLGKHEGRSRYRYFYYMCYSTNIVLPEEEFAVGKEFKCKLGAEGKKVEGTAVVMQDPDDSDNYFLRVQNPNNPKEHIDADTPNKILKYYKQIAGISDKGASRNFWENITSVETGNRLDKIRKKHSSSPDKEKRK